MSEPLNATGTERVNASQGRPVTQDENLWLQPGMDFLMDSLQQE
jgi:hypothetical protein